VPVQEGALRPVSILLASGRSEGPLKGPWQVEAAPQTQVSPAWNPQQSQAQPSLHPLAIQPGTGT